MENYSYPHTPKGVDRQILIPGKDYKRHAIKVGGAIGLFVGVYILLILLAIILAACVSYLGVSLMVLSLSFATIIVGVGLIGVGLMVIFFLIKFLFTIKRYDRSRLIEVKKKDYPILFDFIRKVTEETKTPMPKHIYISADVSACVFYDSSFLSMFFPVKKNLQIGLGLVNSVTLSEFKAVLAHEFGHFSQHSMKLGSYVYNVNKIVLNLLYDNDSFAKTLDRWTSVSSYFILFAKLTIGIVRRIQWVMQKMYLVVNKTDMGLSRQMEYHADTVSAYVCGPNHLISSLNRLPFASDCYNQLINVYNEWLPENIKATNAYDDHSVVMKYTAEINCISMKNGLADIGKKELHSPLKNRIVVNSEWATHPSTWEREKNLESLNIADTPIVGESPWVLFGDHSGIKEQMTAMLFKSVEYSETPQQLANEDFETKYNAYLNRYTYAPEYGGFYTNRSITEMDNWEVLTKQKSLLSAVEEIFTPENSKLSQKIDVLNEEITQLKQLSEPDSQVTKFEFCGEMYSVEKVSELIAKLEEEKEQYAERLAFLDNEVLLLALERCNEEQSNDLISLYRSYYDLDRDFRIAEDLNEKLGKIVLPLYYNQFTTDQIWKVIGEINIAEHPLKKQIGASYSIIKEEEYLDDNLQKKFEIYLNNDLEYFDGQNYNNDMLDLLQVVSNSYVGIMFERTYKAKKVLLDTQLEFLSLKSSAETKRIETAF